QDSLIRALRIVHKSVELGYPAVEIGEPQVLDVDVAVRLGERQGDILRVGPPKGLRDRHGQSIFRGRRGVNRWMIPEHSRDASSSDDRSLRAARASGRTAGSHERHAEGEGEDAPIWIELEGQAGPAWPARGDCRPNQNYGELGEGIWT